jgi:hypothetical protein
MQSGDEIPVPQREDGQRNLLWHVSYIKEKKFSYSSVKNWVA